MKKLKRRSAATGTNGAEAGRAESRALAKGLMVLEHFAQLQRPFSLGDVARVAGLGKPSTLRILATLEGAGWLRREAGLYHLDREWATAPGKSGIHRLTSAARGEMRNLLSEFSETVTVAALLDDLIRVVEVMDSPQLVRMANYKGRLLPPYASSLGKAIAAFQPAERIARLQQTYGVYRFTGKTLTDARAIDAELAKVRQHGFACDDEETVEGGYCLGAPVRDSSGSVMAAISVSQPKQRFTAERRAAILTALARSACRVSGALGYRG
jgi:DNA-binding IclR family transcriptional regulator